MLHCNAESKLIRGNHLYGHIEVENVEAHVCPTCNKVLGWPHNSSGRIALAHHKQGPDYDRVRHFPVPIELTDRVIGLNAALGTLANPEHYFQLAFHVGMKLAYSYEKPPPNWGCLFITTPVCSSQTTWQHPSRGWPTTGTPLRAMSSDG